MKKIKFNIENAKTEEEKDRILSKLSGGKYWWHVLIMTTQWGAASFVYYLITLLEDRVEGSAFMEAYIEGSAGILGSILTLGPLYFWRLRISLIIAWAFALFGAIWLMIFHMRWIPPKSWAVFMTEKSHYPAGSEEEAQFYESDYIVFWVWWVKVSVNWAF